MSAFMDE
jgi:hypothetical protein